MTLSALQCFKSKQGVMKRPSLISMCEKASIGSQNGACIETDSAMKRGVGALVWLGLATCFVGRPLLRPSNRALLRAEDEEATVSAIAPAVDWLPSLDPKMLVKDGLCPCPCFLWPAELLDAGNQPHKPLSVLKPT